MPNKNAALGLEFDLSKINRQMDSVGNRLEESLGGAVKAVDKQFGKMGKGAHLKQAGTSAAQVYGTSFADTFLAVFAGAFIANGGISKILLLDLKKLPKVFSGILRSFSRGLKGSSKDLRDLGTDLRKQFNMATGAAPFEFDPAAAERLSRYEPLLEKLGNSTRKWGAAMLLVKGKARIFDIVAKGADGARGFIVKGTRGLQLFARNAAVAGAKVASAFKGAAIVIGLVVAAVALAGKALWNFGKQAYDAFKRTDIAARSFRKTLDNIAKSEGVGGKAARKALADFRAQAEGLSKTAGIAQGDTLNAANFLSRSGFKKGQVQELLNIGANIAADPANGVNSITDAAELLSDALSGSAGAAERLGIFIKEGDGSAADFANRMAQLQTQLKGNFGGVAQAVSPFALLAETADRIRVSIGEYVAPAMEDIVGEVNALLASISPEEIERIGTFVADSLRTGWEFTKLIWGAVKDIFALVEAWWDSLKARFNFGKVLVMEFAGALFEINELSKRVIKEILAVLLAGLQNVLGPKISDALGLSKLGDKLEDSLATNIKPEEWDSLKRIGEAAKGAFDAGTNTVRAGVNVFRPDDGGLAGRISTGNASIAGAAGLIPQTDNVSLSGSKWVAEQNLRIKEEKDKALEELSKRAEKYAEANSGATLTIGIKNVRPDRFRKVRGR